MLLELPSCKDSDCFVVSECCPGCCEAPRAVNDHGRAQQAVACGLMDCGRPSPAQCAAVDCPNPVATAVCRAHRCALGGP